MPADEIKKIEIGSATFEEDKADSHIPSKIQADTIITYTTEIFNR